MQNEEQREADLGNFAEWVSDNGYVWDGVSLWKKKFYSDTIHHKIISFRTKELVEKYLKERDGSKGGDTGKSQTSMA